MFKRFKTKDVGATHNHDAILLPLGYHLCTLFYFGCKIGKEQKVKANLWDIGYASLTSLINLKWHFTALGAI